MLTAFDVAALRFPSPGSHRPLRDEGLVVADPALPVQLRRRFPELGDLQDGSVEASRVAGLLPASVVLTGAAATKNAVVSRWERASFLHFASHLVRDPEDPYLTFIPLASGGSCSHTRRASRSPTSVAPTCPDAGWSCSRPARREVRSP